MRRLILCLMALSDTAIARDTFEIFTSNKIVSAGDQHIIYDISAGDRLLQSINTQMRLDGVRDETVGREYVTQALKTALAHQVRALNKAAHYQLKYFPAIVINRRYVIYGTVDTQIYYRLRE